MPSQWDIPSTGQYMWNLENRSTLGSKNCFTIEHGHVQLGSRMIPLKANGWFHSHEKDRAGSSRIIFEGTSKRWITSNLVGGLNPSEKNLNHSNTTLGPHSATIRNSTDHSVSISPTWRYRTLELRKPQVMEGQTRSADTAVKYGSIKKNVSTVATEHYSNRR